jgi:hypothetical protein
MLVAVWHSDRGVGFAVPPRLPRFLEDDPRLRFARVETATFPFIG